MSPYFAPRFYPAIMATILPLSLSLSSFWVGCRGLPTPACGGGGLEPNKTPSKTVGLFQYVSYLLKADLSEWCCYITVDSATTALQNGVLAHIGAFLNKCTIKHPFHTQLLHKKSGILWKLHHSVLCEKKTTFWQYYINSEPCMTYNPKWLK